MGHQVRGVIARSAGTPVELVTVLVESPGGNGPYGAKTIGEQPLPPVAPAIANAVYDAVGVRIQDLPITAEKVLAALQQR